jgi:hypothetical protein
VSRLPPEDRALLALARGVDEPTAADRARVGRALARKLGAGAGLVVAATITHAVASSSSAAGNAAAAGAGVVGQGAAGAAGVAGTASAVGAASEAGGAGYLGVLAAVPLAAKILVVAAVLGGGGVSTYRALRAPAPAHEAAVSAPASRVAVTGASASQLVARRAEPSVSAPNLPVPLALAPLASAASPRASFPIAPIAPIAPPSPAASAGVARTVTTVSPRPGVAPAAGPSASREPAPDALVAETGLMREAMAALKGGDASRALALFDRHAREFPNGILAEERGAERVLALCELGRSEDAARGAASFLREHPASRLAGRVRSSCAGLASDANRDARSIP